MKNYRRRPLITIGKILFVCLLLLIAILEVSLLNYISIFNVIPDLTLAAIVILGLSFTPRGILAFAIAAGFFKDLLGASPFGLNTLVFFLIGYAVTKLSRAFIIESLPSQIAVISAAVIAKGLLVQLILPFYSTALPLGIFLRSVLIATLYTSFFSFLSIKVIRHI